MREHPALGAGVERLTGAFCNCGKDTCESSDQNQDEVFESEVQPRTRTAPRQGKTTFSQKNLPGKTDSDKKFPRVFHDFLPEPTDVTVVLWDEDGTRHRHQFRKVKTVPKTWKGAPDVWVRRLILESLTGNVIADEYSPIANPTPTRKVGILTDTDGRVLMLRNAEGELELPSGRVDESSFLFDLKEQTGLTLKKDAFVPIFELSSGIFHGYTQTVKLPKDHPSEFVSPTQPSVKQMQQIETESKKFIDCCGTKIAEVLSPKPTNFCEAGGNGRPCGACLLGCSGPEIAPPFSVNMSPDHEWQEFFTACEKPWATFEDGVPQEVRAPMFDVGFVGPDHLYHQLYSKLRNVYNGIVASSINWTDEELKKEVLTKAGLAKLHRQFWHLQAADLFARIHMIVPVEKRDEVKELCQQVVAECAACRKKDRAGSRPKVGGIWARDVGHVVAGDTFFITHGGKKYAVIHLIDLFSGYSSLWICDTQYPKGPDTISALREWIERFGKAPIVFFSDQGGEFTDHRLAEFLNSCGAKHLFSPPQAPYTNGVNERHNAILKIWISRIQIGAPNAPIHDIIAEASFVKNMTTKRHGFSSIFLAFGHEPQDRFGIRIHDLLEPGPKDTAETVRSRVVARDAARAAVHSAETSKRLREALEKAVQSTDKGPLQPGTAVDYLVIPDSKTNQQYWEGNGTVVAMSDRNNKEVVIRRSNGTVQAVARQRVRSHHVPNLLQLTALDLSKLPAEFEEELRPQIPAAQKEQKDLEKLWLSSTTAKERKDRLEKEWFSSFVSEQEKFVQSQRELVTGLSALFTEVGKKTQRRRKRYKKRIEEDSDDGHSDTSVGTPKRRSRSREKPSISTKVDAPSPYHHNHQR